MNRYFIKLANNTQAHHNQAGVTLLLAVLIMSTIILISITISALVVQEIRASRSSMLTEPAIIGAETAGEQGLYFLKQTGDIPDLCNGSGNTSRLSDTSCGTTDVRIGKDLVYGPVTLTIEAGKPYSFLLYDPTDIQGNLAMVDGSNNPLFERIYIQHVSGTSDVTVTSTTVVGTPVHSGTVSPNSVFNFDSFNIVSPINGDKRQEVVLSVPSGSVTVLVSSQGSFPGTGGIPNFPTIEASACSANVNITNCNVTNTEVYRRKIHITVPTVQ